MHIRQLITDIIFQTQRIRYFTSGKTHLRIRCPYCNDSIKKSHSAHLYIKMSDNDTFPYYCQRCNHSGYVNKKFLSMIGIENEGLNIVLSKANSKIAEKNPKLFKRKVNYPKPQVTDALVTSVNYMRQRFNIQIKATELQDSFKFITDINAFLDCNNIYRDEDFSDFIGFLSYDNTHLNLRNKYDGVIRYRILKIMEEESASKIYIKPSNLNVMEHCRVFITEGALDLFGLYNYLISKEVNLDNTLFIAVNGKGYKFIDNVLIEKGIFNCDFVYCLDNDVHDSFIKEIILNTYLMKRRPFTIIRNSFTGEKDFGVEKEKIHIKNLKALMK